MVQLCMFCPPPPPHLPRFHPLFSSPLPRRPLWMWWWISSSTTLRNSGRPFGVQRRHLVMEAHPSPAGAHFFIWKEMKWDGGVYGLFFCVCAAMMTWKVRFPERSWWLCVNMNQSDCGWGAATTSSTRLWWRSSSLMCCAPFPVSTEDAKKIFSESSCFFSGNIEVKYT